MTLCTCRWLPQRNEMCCAYNMDSADGPMIDVWCHKGCYEDWNYAYRREGLCQRIF